MYHFSQGLLYGVVFGEVATNKRLWDENLIRKVTQLMNNGDLDAFDLSPAINVEAFLVEVLSKNFKTICTTCSAGAEHLKNIDDYLDDVRHFVATFSHLETSCKRGNRSSPTLTYRKITFLPPPKKLYPWLLQ